MAKPDNRALDLFRDLKALSESAFPKRCAVCGAVYDSVKDYILKTEDVAGKSGLKSSLDDEDNDIVELFRNCSCGSTLMDCFSNRRDASSRGQKQRELFGSLMEKLHQKGLPLRQARLELLKLLHGEQSSVLESMGVKTRVN
ncbi:MAG: oxidoreductase [Desulfobacteraceae bacterium]|nr:oxidoreductase [Desulfobacteraceae bacterium]